jgi:hypothetical protein
LASAQDVVPEGPGLNRLLQYATAEPEGIAGTRQQLTTFFGQYPGLDGWRLRTRGPKHPIQYEYSATTLTWGVKVTLPRGRGVTEEDEFNRRAISYHGAFEVYPALNPPGKPAHPFLAWWALLFVLSKLARYQPREWMKLIDLDGHRDAAAIDYLLDEALSAVPELALGALQRVMDAPEGGVLHEGAGSKS